MLAKHYASLHTIQYSSMGKGTLSGPLSYISLTDLNRIDTNAQLLSFSSPAQYIQLLLNERDFPGLLPCVLVSSVTDTFSFPLC